MAAIFMSSCGSIRRYGEVDVTRARFVKSASVWGAAWTHRRAVRLEDSTHCDEANGLAEHKDMREKLADLTRMEAALVELMCTCHARKGCFLPVDLPG